MIWVLIYLAFTAGLAIALGKRLRDRREAHERLAAFKRRHLGL